MIPSIGPEKDYELLDSGEGMKLERFGAFTLARPDPEAIWKKGAPELWETGDATFVRKGKTVSWKKAKSLPPSWTVEFSGLTFLIKPTSFKHTGLFPEQLSNWQWMEEKLKNKKAKVLNLFGYTGGATLIGARAGAEVTHVDGSKSAVAWARENAKLSQLSDRPIRWILDDAVLFMRRELKRGNRYDAIIMDPPTFGHGPSGELWKIEEGLGNLLDLALTLLSDTPLFVLMSGYAAGYSHIAYGNTLLPFQEKFGGAVTSGELALRESSSERLLPAGIFARWESEA